jgi:hypothetical protein
MPGSDNTKLAQLYGGAITALIPTMMQDASDIRQVPDHQEVFLDKGSNNSLIIEILESTAHRDLVNSKDRIILHWNDILEANQCAKSQLLSEAEEHTSKSGAIGDFKVQTVTGVQAISKFNRNDYDVVLVFMGALLWDKFETDLVVTFHCVLEENVSDLSNFDRIVNKAKELKEQQRNVFRKVLQSIELKDASLFSV